MITRLSDISLGTDVLQSAAAEKSDFFPVSSSQWSSTKYNTWVTYVCMSKQHQNGKNGQNGKGKDKQQM